MLSDGEIAQGLRGIANRQDLLEVCSEENNHKKTNNTSVTLCKRIVPVQTHDRTLIHLPIACNTDEVLCQETIFVCQVLYLQNAICAINFEMCGIKISVKTYHQPESACTGDKQNIIVSLVEQATQNLKSLTMTSLLKLICQTCVLSILIKYFLIHVKHPWK